MLRLHTAAFCLLSFLCLACFVGCSEKSKTSKTEKSASVAPETGSQTKTTSEKTAEAKTDSSVGVINKVETPPAPEATGDDAELVKSIKERAASIKLNADGFVVVVNFRKTDIDDSVLELLPKLAKLSELLLNEAPITDAGLEHVGKCLQLTNLDLRGCAVGNAGIAHLGGLSKLKGLRLNDSDGKTTVDDDALETIAKLKSLKALPLDGLWVYTDGLAKLAVLPNLEELYLSKCPIGDDTLEVLATFPKLKKLRLSQTVISGEGLAHLAKLKTLEDLDISEVGQLNDDAMQHLAGMTQLKKLNLWRIQISDAGVSHLAGLTKLEWLNLDNTLLSNDGLVHLKDMQALDFLHLGSTLITDEGLQKLEGLKALTKLIVTRTGATEAGTAALKEKLPNATIQLKYLGDQ